MKRSLPVRIRALPAKFFDTLFPVRSAPLFAIFLLLAETARGAVALPHTETFNYAEGNLISVSGGTWILGNGSSTFEIAVSNSAALTAPAGFPAASAKGVSRLPGGSARRAALPFASVTAVDGAAMYVSFLLKVITAPGSSQLIGYLDNNSTSQGSPQAGIFLDNGPKVGIAKKSSAPAFTLATNLDSSTHLVVVRYTFQPGNDRVDLWVDPAATDYGAGTSPPSLGSATGGSDPPSLDYFQISSPGTSGGLQYLDELRVGTTWADVVPSGGPLVGAKLGFTTQPANAAPGAIMSPVVVQVQDASGVAVSSNAVPVSIALSSGPGVLSGTLSRNTDPTGKAIFNDLSIDTGGTGDQLSASASGIGSGLADANSSTFDITTGGGGGGGGTPYITQGFSTPAGFVVKGTNTAAGAFCQIVGSPDITLDPANWLLVSFDNFASDSSIGFTNPTSIAMPNAYYRLRTGNTDTKIQAPGLTALANQTIPIGTTVNFNTTATAPLLQYLWLLNGHPITGATTSSLTIASAQLADAGSYAVVVANPAGSVSSSANLRVGNYPPSIISPPQNAVITAGGDAVFNVIADGTAPLIYLWKDNNNATIPGATNATLTLQNVPTNTAGTYTVFVSNNFGSTNRSAALTVNSVPTALPDTNMIGFAQLAGVTGGLGGTDVYATNYLSFSNFVRHAEALTIHVTNQITGPGPDVDEFCYVYGNNKTIIGEGTNAGINGIDLRINATNIIIANLTFQVTPVGTNDAITLDGGSKGTAKGIWVDHCTISNAQDGSIDVTKGADNVTISWCKIIYGPKIPGNVHEFAHLIGSSDKDGDVDHLFHVTLHHNWYGTNAMERMPSVRWGRVHVYNCFYTASGNNYCARTRIGSQVLVENNFYQGVQNPWELYTTTGTTGLLLAVSNNIPFLSTAFGNTWVSGWTSGASLIPGTNSLSSFSPVPYAYLPDDASVVPYYVQTYAGAGKYPYAP